MLVVGGVGRLASLLGEWGRPRAERLVGGRNWEEERLRVGTGMASPTFSMALKPLG